MQKEVDEENASKKAYESLKADKLKEIKANIAEITEKTAAKTKAEEALVKSKASLKKTQKTLDEDIKFQAAVEKRCSGNNEEYDQRIQDRAIEMEAVSKTMAVLRSDEARSNFRKSMSDMSFLQESSESVSSKAKAASAFLIATGQKLGAQKMVTLGVESRIDSFTKVKKAIADMVSALKAEQKDEVDKRDMCIDDLNKNEISTQDKDNFRQKVEGNIVEVKKTISKLSDDIQTTSDEIAEMRMQVQIAGETRQKENLAFQTDSDEQNQTQIILTKAVKFLANVYGGGASSAVTSFVQIQSHEVRQDPDKLGAPESFKKYKKNTAGLGAVTLIESIIEDSKKVQTEAIVDEQEAQTAYEDFVKSTGESIKAKDSQLDDTKKAKAEAQGDLAEEDASREATMDELEKLHKTFMNIHKECDWALANFEIRQKARDQEMQALAQAKGILGGADFGK